MSINYTASLDGLRGYAVLSVILFTVAYSIGGGLVYSYFLHSRVF